METMKLQNKKVVVVGLGKSGMAARKLLLRMGAKVCLYDGNKEADVSDLTEPVYLGEFPKEKVTELDLAVFSPGVPLDIPLADLFREAGVPIIGEIELAYMLEKGAVIGITGTNGKTTTTTLVGEIMKAHFKEVLVVGNIGTPYTEMVLNSTKDSVTVAEISSFQLETVSRFRPNISAILNITPDHLNRHKTMECYIDTKLNIGRTQRESDVLVLNYDDEVLREKAKEMPARIVFFSSRKKLPSGIYLDDNGDIIYAEENQVIVNVHDCRLLGLHNYENYMAAVAIALSMNIPVSVIKNVVEHFAGVEHRIEFVTEKHGVAYYNDSKGTNPDAAIKGIEAMNRKTVLIGGGYDKKSDFTKWIMSFKGKVKYLILLGETTDQIEKTAVKCGFTDTVRVDTLEEAVKKAGELAEDGEAVLLSPACASWDMFQSYEQRGDLFKQYVNNLE